MMFKKKQKKSFLATGKNATYTDGILVIYDKVLKTPDSYISITNVTRTGASYWRPHIRLILPGILLTFFGLLCLAEPDFRDLLGFEEEWAFSLIPLLLGIFLFVISLKKTHGLHLELNSGAKITFLAPDADTATNAAVAIAEVMRNPETAREPITFNFNSSQTTTMIDSSTNVNNQNYGVNYGSVGNSANYYNGGYGSAPQQPYGQVPNQNPGQNQYPYYR